MKRFLHVIAIGMCAVMMAACTNQARPERLEDPDTSHPYFALGGEQMMAFDMARRLSVEDMVRL